MNAKIVLTAQQFCGEHFCNNNLDTDNYMSILDNYLNEFDTQEEKVAFLVEVKRIGKLFISNELKHINEVELFDISKQVHEPF